MDSLGASHPWASSMGQADDCDRNSSRSNYPNHAGPTSNNTAQLAPHHPPAQTIIQVCGDVKPRLTKEQHDILERHFQQQSKPTTSTKKGFADALGVPLDKINVRAFPDVPTCLHNLLITFAELVPEQTGEGEAGPEEADERICHVSSNDGPAFATFAAVPTTTAASPILHTPRVLWTEHRSTFNRVRLGLGLE
jgi:hypothetical protein